VRFLRLVAVAPLLALSGCGTAPELVIGGVGIVLDGTPENTPHYFGTQLCFEDEQREVTITDATVREPIGEIGDLRILVDWPGGQEAEPVGSAPQPVPPAYEPAAGSTGTVTECGDDNQADLAIVFPETGSEPIGVKGIEIDYEADGDAGTAVGELTLVQCPVGELGSATDPDSVGGGSYCKEPAGG
jgi:hypothetical protein